MSLIFKQTDYEFFASSSEQQNNQTVVHFEVRRKVELFRIFRFQIIKNNLNNTFSYQASSPLLAYHMDCLISEISCETLRTFLAEVFIHCTSESCYQKFVAIKDDQLCYLFMLLDHNYLKDFANHAFTFRCLAKKLMRREHISYLIHCNRQVLILNCIAEELLHQTDTHDKQDPTYSLYQEFVNTATISPLLYAWLQTQQRLIGSEPSILNFGPINEFRTLAQICMLPKKVFQQALTISEKFENYVKILGSRYLTDTIYLKEHIPFTEKLKWQKDSHLYMFNYLLDINNMLADCPNEIRNTYLKKPINTINQLVKLHDKLALNRHQTLRFSKLLEQNQENINIESSSATFTKEQLQKIHDDLANTGKFPSFPSLGKSKGILQIKNLSELVLEATEQSHCAASNQYILKILSGQYAFYKIVKPQRLTMLVKQTSNAELIMIEVSGKRNAKPTIEALEMIHSAIDKYNQCKNFSFFK